LAEARFVFACYKLVIFSFPSLGVIQH